MTGRRDAVDALRAELRRRSLDGFLVPRADEYQGEYVPPSAARLAWLTGFTGSAGIAVLLLEKGAVFSDGRYTLQMPEQVDTEVFECLHISDDPPSEWIAANLPPGGALGYDPWLHVEKEVRKFEQRPPPRPAVVWSPARIIPWTRPGPTGRLLRPRLWSPTTSLMPAASRPTSAASLPPGWTRPAATPPC